MISKINKLIEITDNINSELGFVLKNCIICGNSLIFAKNAKFKRFFFMKFSFRNPDHNTKAYSEPRQTSKIELFPEIGKG